MMKLYEFYQDCGRIGNLQGIFLADEDDIKEIMNRDVYFGEVLGKHSNVTVKITEENLKLKSEDEDFIAKCTKVFGTGTISGYNPLDYIEE